MLSRRRRAATLAVSALLLSVLAACGDDSAEDADGLEGLAAVEISGEYGEEPEVTWKDKLVADEVEMEVLSEGDGAEVAEGDEVSVNYWVGNGFTQQKTYSTYDSGAPETVPVSDEVTAAFKDALLGQTIGSRVAVTSSAKDAFGEMGNPGLGIGNKDTVLLILDLMKPPRTPQLKDVSAARQPALVEKDGQPTGFDFSGIDKPSVDGNLLRTIVKQGTGKPVTKDMELTVDYLGSVYEGAKPFDESFSKEPATFKLTEVIGGWTQGLDGVKVGSRVLLAIPPSLGYGPQEQANIPANSTLYFVVDIISAK
ncbi:FKBP-type peptidyl-prolyl cis-trans isomerase [Nocardioides sp. cx-169]|uniref:FKBP-type peptidyl-prolyl cis-trans isomerase n=1 Tax=Nocardioides sp. cx-169 TaxID=2899080 RepID=UPI001E59F953|nr:FKBP-type peptidyl-prolyl cis-trans isomerase [Nocardioides sp. cx-169]MCD4535326.1 FKBP-type peptidyl-prolyl cis-trans isomerase [Nocardioides sp. cx-169]